MKGINIEPYNIPGRWYQLFLESNDGEVVITSSDVDDVEISGNYIKFPEDFHVMERLYDIHTVEHTGQKTIAIDIVTFADGTQAIQKPDATAFDYGYIYVMGHYEK